MHAAALADLAHAERVLYLEAQGMALAGRVVTLELPPNDAYHWTIVLCVMLHSTYPNRLYTKPEPAESASCA